MTHLRDGVPNRVVDEPLGRFAPMDMGHGKMKRQRRDHCRVHFKAVPEHQQEIRPRTRVASRKRRDAPAHSGGDGFRLVRVAWHGHPIRNRKAVRLDPPYRESVALTQVRPADKELQPQQRLPLDRPEDRHEAPVVGPPDRHDTDGSRTLSLRHAHTVTVESFMPPLDVACNSRNRFPGTRGKRTKSGMKGSPCVLRHTCSYSSSRLRSWLSISSRSPRSSTALKFSLMTAVIFVASPRSKRNASKSPWYCSRIRSL